MTADITPAGHAGRDPDADLRLLPADRPWWEGLEPDFYRRRDCFELHGTDRIQARAAGLIDTLIRSGVALATATLAVPFSLRPQVLLRDRAERQFYKDLASGGDASRFFVRPPAGVPVRCQSAGSMAVQPPGGERLLLTFDSPFEAVNPRLREPYGSHARNRTAWAQYWRHDGDRPRPTLCLLHGYVFDSYAVNSRFFDVPDFFARGYDVLLYTLPFHGYRQGLLSPFSGHGYFAHGALHINEAFAHAVYDFRIFLDWLLAQGAPAAGVTGLSLGGYATALLACAEERLAFAIPVIPPASLVDVAFQWAPLGQLLRTMLWSAGIGIEDSRHTLAVSSPLTWPSLLPPERLMIVAAMGDGLTYPKQARLLREHWGQGVPLHWFPGGHIVHFGQPGYLAAMHRFLDGIGFRP